MDEATSEQSQSTNEVEETDPLEIAKIKGAEIAVESVLEPFSHLVHFLRIAYQFNERGQPLPAGMMTVEQIANEMKDIILANKKALRDHKLAFGHQFGDPNLPVLNTHPQADNSLNPHPDNLLFQQISEKIRDEDKKAA